MAGDMHKELVQIFVGGNKRKGTRFTEHHNTRDVHTEVGGSKLGIHNRA